MYAISKKDQTNGRRVVLVPLTHTYKYSADDGNNRELHVYYDSGLNIDKGMSKKGGAQASSAPPLVTDLLHLCAFYKSTTVNASVQFTFTLIL